MRESVQALLSGIIDYAGLFPPAGLGMAETVRNYASHLASDEAWMLARLIVPVTRLEEFESAAADVLPKEEGAEPWRLSALVGPETSRDLDRIASFNENHLDPSRGRVVIDAIEMKADSAARIDAAMERMPEWLLPHFELPLSADVRGLIAALAGDRMAAKARTGGPTADLFPSSEQLARFILACAAADAPFKATAGLHHPLRGEYKLTYEPDSPRGTMHGFLNVFIAGCLAKASLLGQAEAVDLLEERSLEAFEFTDEDLAWRDRRLSVDQIARARREFALSFGSCSFTEPVDDLKSLGLTN